MNLIEIKHASNLTISHNGEHYIFGKDLIKGINPDILQIADVLPSYNIYKTRVEYESVLFKLSGESKETAEIASLNQLRISCWRLITAYLNYFAEGQVPTLQKAARDLQFVLKTYHNLTELTLFEKTGYISDAIDALKEAPAQAAIALLPGLSHLVDDLEAYNIGLDDLYIKREQDKAFVHGLGTLSDYRPLVDQALFDLIGDLNSAYRRNELGAKNPTLKAALERIANTVIGFFDKMHNNLARRGSTGKKHPQKPDITNPEVPGGGGEGGDGGDGGGDGYETPDITNPEVPFE